MPPETRAAPARKNKPLVRILGGIGLLSVCAALTWGVVGFRAHRGAKNGGFHPGLTRTRPGLAMTKMAAAPHMDLQTSGGTSGEPGSSQNIGGAPRIGNEVLAPSVLSKVEPEYSEAARGAGLQGTVVVSMVVDEEGNTKDLKVIQALGLGLDQKAIEAFQKWKFRPGMADGHAVAVQATLQVNFRLTAAPGVVTIAINPSTPATLHAGTRGSGVFKSTNGGTSWTTVNSGLTATDVSVLAIDPSNVFTLAIDPSTPTTLYSGNQNGVFKSTNGGTSWTAANSGLRQTAVQVLANWELQASSTPIQPVLMTRGIQGFSVTEKNLPELQKVRRVILLDDIDQDEDLTDQALSAEFFSEVFKKLETLTCFKLALMKDAPPPAKWLPADGYAYLVTTVAEEPVARGHVSIWYDASVLNNGLTFWNGAQQIFYADDPPSPAMPERVADFLGAVAKDACPGWKQP